MTTLQIQFGSHFLAPVTEDPMELTSNMDQRAGGADDIDIDLDLTGDNPQDGEDEFMGEEDVNALMDSTSADEQETLAANDDEMADDIYAQGMVDEVSSVRDEDIKDAEYTGPELDEDTIAEPDTGQSNERSKDRLADDGEIVGEQNHEQDYQDQEYQGQELNEQEHHEYLTTSEIESDVNEGAVSNGQTELASPNHDVANLATGETSERHHREISKEAIANHGAADHTSKASNIEGVFAPEAKPEQVRGEVLPISLDEEVVASLSVEGSHTKEEDHLNSPTHLHPIVLDYQGDEMYLFPPVDQNGDHASTFLLADEQLAYSTLGNLLEACRCVLKGSLSEQDELVINFDDLDLHISESTTECAITKLSEVVDLYFRLQQNDGLENPPPLYIDLTTRNRFSHRLNVLLNASIEGTGLSQLIATQETEGETDPSNHTAKSPTYRAYLSEQQSGEEAEGSMGQFDSHGRPLPLENLMLETDVVAQGTQSYPIKDVAHEEIDRPEPLLSSGSSAREARGSNGVFSEVQGSKEFIKHAQTLAGDLELQKAEESIVDDGDFIDYEDFEEVEGGTSSASSTLKGDTIVIHAVQDRAAPNESTVEHTQEHQSPNNVHRDAIADDESLHEYVEEEDTRDVGVPVDEGQTDAAEIPSQDLDDKSQVVSGQFDEEGKVSEKDQNVSISQDTESRLTSNFDDQRKVSALYEDDAGSYWQDKSHEHTDQTEGDAGPVAGTNLDDEVEDYSSIYPLDSESGGSRGVLRDADAERVNDLEVENELEEADRLLANDDNGHVLRPLEEVNTQRSLFVDELTHTQEDDDEITYEDEQYDVDSPHEPAQANHNVATNPVYLKRARILHEDDDTLEEDFQDAKRVRSG